MCLLSGLSDERQDTEDPNAYMTQLEVEVNLSSGVDLPPYEEPPPPYTPPKPPDILPHEAPPPYREQTSDNDQSQSGTLNSLSSQTYQRNSAVSRLDSSSQRHSTGSESSSIHPNCAISTAIAMNPVSPPIDSYGNLFAVATLTIGMRGADNASFSGDTISRLNLGKPNRYSCGSPVSISSNLSRRPRSLEPSWDESVEIQSECSNPRNSYYGGEMQRQNMPDILCIGNNNTKSTNRHSFSLDTCFPHVDESRHSVTESIPENREVDIINLNVSDAGTTSADISGSMEQNNIDRSKSCRSSAECDTSVEILSAGSPGSTCSNNSNNSNSSENQESRPLCQRTEMTNPGYVTESNTNTYLSEANTNTYLSESSDCSDGRPLILPFVPPIDSPQSPTLNFTRSASTRSGFSVCSETGERRQPKFKLCPINKATYPQINDDVAFQIDNNMPAPIFSPQEEILLEDIPSHTVQSKTSSTVAIPSETIERELALQNILEQNGSNNSTICESKDSTLQGSIVSKESTLCRSQSESCDIVGLIDLMDTLENQRSATEENLTGLVSQKFFFQKWLLHLF